MKEKSKKSRFIGIRVTEAQEKLLIKLQEAYGYKTRTDLLLHSLESLADSSPVQPGAHPRVELQAYEEAMKRMIAVVSRVDEIVDRHGKDESALIQILLEIQQEYSWLPKEALLWLSERLGVPLNRIYQIASFYKAFSLIPRGRHLVKVCSGTACHVRGAMTLLDRATQILALKPGETSTDLRFSLETVNCLGCCALGPVIVIDDETRSKPSTPELEKLFAARE